MLSLSAGDEAELERWRTMAGRCELPEQKRRPFSTAAEAVLRLPRAMSIIVRDKLHAAGALGPVRLNPGEVADVESLDKISRVEIMLHLLGIGSALAQTQVPGGAIGAVAEGGSGAFYVGSNIEWRGPGIKFSVHGAQAAVLSAWMAGETQLHHLMVETEPCACCRQFLRETWDWTNMKVLIVPDGPGSAGERTIKEIGLNLKGLRTDGLAANLLREPKQAPAVVDDQRDLAKLAAASALLSYAPYSRNFAGVALRAKNGVIHHGRYAETRESIAGVMAIEAALINIALCGGQMTEVEDIVLVESKGMVTQFAATQQLAQRMGGIPFRFLMTKG